jgi:type II secretory pathway pseudopilin PulG
VLFVFSLLSAPHVLKSTLAVLKQRKTQKSPPLISPVHAFVFSRRGQSGALFGLDARLALMVFGILALVTGFVAFGRVGLARQAALLGELQAFDLALTQYQKDMGTFYLFTLDKQPDDTDSSEDLAALWDNTRVKEGFKARWSGPYLNRDQRKSHDYGFWGLFYATADRQNACSTESDCALWLTLSNVSAERWAEVNRAVDEGGGKYSEGEAGSEMNRGRVQADGETNPRILFYRIEGRDGL